MAKTMTSELALTIIADYVDDTELNRLRGKLNYPLEDSLADGSAANQADHVWWDSRTLIATSEELDLAWGIEDAFNDPIAFVLVKLLYIRNKSTTPGEVLAIGGAAANQFVNWVANSSDIVQIPPDSFMLLWNPIDGYAVTGGTGDKLKIDSGGATIDYDIVILGTAIEES